MNVELLGLRTGGIGDGEAVGPHDVLVVVGGDEGRHGPGGGMAQVPTRQDRAVAAAGADDEDVTWPQRR